jgi:hypothetical protein
MNTSSFTEPDREPPPLDAVPDDDVNALPPGEPAAEDEYDEPEEEPEPEVDTEPRLHVPRVLIWAGLGLFSLACAITFFLGFARSSWYYGNDQQVDLSGCLPKLRDALAAANAPASVLQRLATAAQPGMWESEAYLLLTEARQMLEPLGNDPAIAAVLKELKLMLPDNQYGYLGCNYSRVKNTTPILPTLRPVP